MGCSQGDLCWRQESAEAPRHEVTLPAFCVERFEVPLEDYRSCLNDGVCAVEPLTSQDDDFCNWSSTPGGNELHPINCISWSAARSYCQGWMGGDLLSEAEWEMAARGTQALVYPWGDTPEPSCDRCNFDVNGADASDTKGCGKVSMGPATWTTHDDNNGALGASPCGARDMAGNVHEWVLDCFDPFFYTTCSGGCEDPVNLCGDDGQRVIRGGAFSTINPDYLRAVWRGSLYPDEASPAVGFRCRHPAQ